MTLTCVETKDFASLFLDGRLVASRRAEVQEHLRSCDACTVEFRALRRLSSLVCNLPTPLVMPGLAARVRAEVQSRRADAEASIVNDRPTRNRVRILVAALLIAVPLAGFSWILRESLQGDGSVEIVELVESPQPASVLWDACRAEGVEPGRFARAARGVVGDLALSRDLRPVDCRAMIAAQLELFDLERSGARLLRVTEANDGAELVLDLRRLARFVIDLAEDIDRPSPGFELRRWQEEARDSRLYDLLELAADRSWRQPSVAEPLAGLVVRVAGDLSPSTRQELVVLLEARANWVKGAHGASVGLAKSLSTRRLRPVFGASLDYTLASSLYAAERPQAAEPFVRRLTARFAGDGPSVDDPLAGAWLRGVVDAELAQNR